MITQISISISKTRSDSRCESRERAERGIGAPRASELGGVQGSPPLKEEQREIDDYADLDFNIKDEV